MRINTNISALYAQRQLAQNQAASARSMERLSSGMRINRTGDDAVGLAISEKMRAQIRGLKQATRNAQDGISLIQTAEGALKENQAILQRMRELASQAASDTHTEVDRGEIQKEIDQLAEEIDRISKDTEFNTKKLIDGKLNVRFHIGANLAQSVQLKINAMDANSLRVSGEVYEAKTITGLAGVEIYTRTGEAITIEAVAFTENDNPAVEKTTAKYENGKITITLAQENGDSSSAGAITATHRDVLDALNLVSAEAGVFFEATSTFVETEKASTSIAADIKAADATEGTKWTIDAESSTAGINVTSQKMADNAIVAINDAIENVSAERSMLGAMQNRLEHTIANLGTSAENLQAAESRIRDVDMAEEIMNFTKNNILQQAAMAMLAQANMAPQSVLQLLS